MDSTIYDILECVSKETDLSVEQIKSPSKEQRIVDARHIAVMAMLELGIYPKCIASMFGSSVRNIYYIKQNFHRRIKWNRMLRQHYDNVILAVKKL